MSTIEKTTHFDKEGNIFFVVDCGPEDFLRILDMYDSYMPEAVAQGLPPTNKDTRHTWLFSLLHSGENFAALMEGRVVGHGALLVNMEKQDGEYLIFVANPFRKRGIASILTESTIIKARQIGLTSIWLTVESDNFRAIKLYRKMGFVFCEAGLSERKMTLML